MKRPIYAIGRGLQLLGLLILPSAIWAGSIGRSEKNSIFLFLGSIAVFYAGYLLTRLGMRL